MKSFRWLPGIMLVLAFFAGCGASSGVASQPTATSTATPTFIPTDTPTVSPAAVAAACGNDFAQGSSFSQVGDMIFTQPRLGGLSYPGLQLPDGALGNMPYHLSVPTSTLNQTGVETPANPNVGSEGGTFSFGICNASPTQKHVLQAVSAKIVTLTPDTSDSINVEAGCDAAFSSKTRQYPAGGCGGSIAGSVEAFKVTWPAVVTVGTSAATVIETDNELSNPAGPSTAGLYGNFPVTLAPGKSIGLFMEMTYPSQAGTYTFVFGLQTDGAIAIYPDSAIATKPVFLAQHVHTWSGNACLDPTYLAQIPSGGPAQFYLCPVKGS